MVSEEKYEGEYPLEEAGEEEVYSSEGREKLVEEDEMSPWEAAFMEGAEGEGQNAKCRTCGKMLDREHAVIEKVIEGELYKFCSDECVEKHERSSK
jgi:hypothetical protein